MVRPQSCRVIYYFDTPALGRRHQSFGCVSVQPISRVLEVQMTSIFMSIVGSSSDVSNDVLFRQDDKDFHQVKSWPPTQQLVIKSIVPNFGL